MPTLCKYSRHIKHFFCLENAWRKCIRLPPLFGVCYCLVFLESIPKNPYIRILYIYISMICMYSIDVNKQKNNILSRKVTKLTLNPQRNVAPETGRPFRPLGRLLQERLSAQLQELLQGCLTRRVRTQPQVTQKKEVQQKPYFKKNVWFFLGLSFCL